MGCPLAPFTAPSQLPEPVQPCWNPCNVPVADTLTCGVHASRKAKGRNECRVDVALLERESANGRDQCDGKECGCEFHDASWLISEGS